MYTKRYLYNGKKLTLDELRNNFPKISWSDDPSYHDVEKVGVDLIYIDNGDNIATSTPDYANMTLEEVRQYKLNELKTISDNQLNVIREGYTEAEITSFESQRKGAEDILNGITSTMDAQLVIGLAAQRSKNGAYTIPPEYLANRILANVKKAKEYTVLIVGKYQGLYDKVNLCKTKEEILSINY